MFGINEYMPNSLVWISSPNGKHDDCTEIRITYILGMTPVV